MALLQVSCAGWHFSVVTAIGYMKGYRASFLGYSSKLQIKSSVLQK